MESEAQAVTCDCAKQLVGDLKSPTDHTTQLTQKDKYEEPCITAEFIRLDLCALPTIDCFANHLFSPVQGFEDPLLHPPAFS